MYSYDRRASFSRYQLEILEELRKSPRGVWSFTTGSMRAGIGPKSKLYPTRTRLRDAALELERQGVVFLDRTPFNHDGERYTEIVVRVNPEHDYWRAGAK